MKVSPILRSLPLWVCLALGCGDDGATSSQGGSGGTGASTPTTSSGGGDGASTSSGGVGGIASGGGGGEAPDPCLARTPTCATPAPTSAGQGLVRLDACAYGLDRDGAFTTMTAFADALETIATRRTMADVLADLNRTAVPITGAAVPGDPLDVTRSFRWEDEENDKPTWVPQGITGSFDAGADGLVNGKRLAVVSFYFKEDEAPMDDPKGVRLAIVDLTDPAAPTYRFVLLVEPVAGPNWVPVTVHAGGIAWVGDRLYVADTFQGFRVFDMTRFLQADTAEDVIGCALGVCRAGLYKYALPQVGKYQRWSACATAPRFSFVALDRSSSPPRLVSGEYCSGDACDTALSGRVARYPLDPLTGLLAKSGRTHPEDAFFMGEAGVQGAVSVGDVFLFSSSAPAGPAGALYRVEGNARVALPWVDAPEDLMVDAANDRLWSLSEGLGNRTVFGATLSSYLTP